MTKSHKGMPRPLLIPRNDVTCPQTCYSQHSSAKLAQTQVAQTASDQLVPIKHTHDHVVPKASALATYTASSGQQHNHIDRYNERSTACNAAAQDLHDSHHFCIDRRLTARQWQPFQYQVKGTGERNQPTHIITGTAASGMPSLQRSAQVTACALLVEYRCVTLLTCASNAVEASAHLLLQLVAMSTVADAP
jgi:hypothetical protein